LKPISGTWQYSDGTPAAGASLWMKLPQDAVALGTAQIAPQWVRKILDNTGSLPNGTLVFFTDELSPSGLTYTISVVAPGGGLIWGAESVPITGASFNLNTAVPTTLNILLASPVIQNPTSIQTITNFALADTVGFQAGFGSVSTPSYTFIGDTNTGIYEAAADDMRFSIGGVDSFRIDGTSPTVPSGRPLAWGSAGVTSRDVGLSRIGANLLAVGNGTQGSISGSIFASVFSAVNGVQQQSATTAFTLLDNAGIAHFFIAGSSPFTNTFIQGNGSGTTFIGTGAKAVNIPDANNLIQFPGATSGQVNLHAAAIAGNTDLTLPNSGTDTIAITNGTQTFLNKTLGGTGSTNKDTLVNRERYTQGTALVAGDFALSAGWGNTATITVVGTDSAFRATITPNGAGIAANPTVTLTYHDGTWTNRPIVGITRADGNIPTAIWIDQAGSSATAAVMQFVGTPSAGVAMVINITVAGI
jgi:hypothetical protein